MQLGKERTEEAIISDKVYAAMETGNAGWARTVLTEYREVHEEEAERIRLDVLKDFGINL